AGQAGDPYQAAVVAADQALGRLMDAVARLRPRAVVAVAADHGAGRGDHGEETHGFLVYSATTRVPRLGAARDHPPARVRPVAALMDVMPTLLALAGLSVPAGLDGVNLLPSRGALDAARGVPIEDEMTRAGYGMAALHAYRAGSYLFVSAPRPEVYDADQDGAETDDAAARLPQVAQDLARRLQPFVVANPAPGAGSAPAVDPKDGHELYARYQRAVGAASDGRH